MQTPDDELLHPDDGPNPPQPPAASDDVLGAAPLTFRDFPTEGTPPFINKRLDLAGWESYCAAYQFGPLAPSRVVLHHTLVPRLDQWAGLATMRGMQRYYAGKGWTSGPHIYTGPDGIWLATPMSRVGIHAGVGNGSVRQGWYSIGLEMVGDYDQTKPAGEVWRNTLAVLAGLSQRLGIPIRRLLAFHRDYTTQKSCPGRAVTKEWVWSEVEARQRTIVNPPTARRAPYDELSPLDGIARLSPEWVAAYLERRGAAYAPYDLGIITRAIWAQATEAGLNPDLVAAQLAHETGNLTSWWSQRPRRNPAGIGVTGQVIRQRPTSITRQAGGDTITTWAQQADGTWAEGISFPTWEHAVRAHVGRLLLYTVGLGATRAQQALAAYALEVRPLPRAAWESVTTLKALGAIHNPANLGKPREQWTSGWAWPGDRYGAHLAEIANAMLEAAL